MKWGEFEITPQEWVHGKSYDLSIADEPAIYADAGKLLVVVEALIGVDDSKEYVKMGVSLVDLIKKYVVDHELKDRSFDTEYPEDMEDAKTDIAITIRDLKHCIDILLKT